MELVRKGLEQIRQPQKEIWEAICQVNEVNEILRSSDSLRILTIGTDPRASLTRMIKSSFPGANIVAVERDPSVVEKAREAVANLSNVQIKEGSFPVDDLSGEFDLALALNLIHIPPSEKAEAIVRGMEALVRPKGVLVFSAPLFFGNKTRKRIKAALGELPDEGPITGGWGGRIFWVRRER